MRPHLNAASQRWQTTFHWLVAAYVGLWAFVMPFVCWGALAEPGHPHLSPHFVFVDPPMLHSSHGQDAHHDALDQAEHNAANEEPAAPGRPATLLVALLGFVVTLSVSLQPLARYIRRLWIYLAGRVFIPSVPTPPPRLPLLNAR